VTASLSVVLPAYDEAPHIAAHVRRLAACLRASGRPFEILVVDDGSRDGTAEAARAVEDPAVRVLAHARNRGKGRALATGCAAAREDVIVLLDADLEIPPEDVLPLVARLEACGAEVAVGSKYHPEASLAWPPLRRALSRLYQLATAMLFRLPLRDTQTGLKAIRRGAARALVPRLRSRRFAWDLELVLLAHRSGLACVTGPVHVTPAERASRVGWRGALEAGVDTLRIFARDVGLAAYAPRGRRRRRATRLLVSGDDLGLSPAVDEGLLASLERGALSSVSVLAEAPRAPEAAEALRARAPRSDVGLHLDLLRGHSPAAFALSSLRADLAGEASRRALSAQLARLRALGLEATHLDAHRHAWCLPWTRRRVCRAARAAGLGAVRSLRPWGPAFARGLREGLGRVLLRVLALASAGVARAHGLAVPDGWVDARTAADWVAAGRLPPRVRGRTLEVIAHPRVGPDDVPACERGTLDRAAEARAVLDPPLAPALVALGAQVVDFRTLARERRS
jgi:hypothetical protein